MAIKSSDNQSSSKKGGKAVSQSRAHMSKIGKKGNEARGQQLTGKKAQSTK